MLVSRVPGGHHAAYSPSLPLRPYRPRVESTRTAASVPRKARAPTQMARTPYRRCRVLSTALRLRLADAAPGASALAETVYHHFRKWRLDGRLRQEAHERLRAAVRQSEGRNPYPSGALIDSQALKGSGVGGPKCLKKGFSRDLRGLLQNSF